jgi:hypothetical protein
MKVKELTYDELLALHTEIVSGHPMSTGGRFDEEKAVYIGGRAMTAQERTDFAQAIIAILTNMRKL